MSGLRATVDVADRVAARVQAAPGEVLVVIGPNGAGKSTLLRALAGLEDMTGTVVVGGVEWTRLPVPRRRIGFVFQDQSLFPHLTALDNVAFGPRCRGVGHSTAERTARDWLDRFGLTDLAQRRPRQLSGGQAQRVAIARALAADPALLLLDEPFAGLDVSVAASLRLELTQHLAEFRGVTLLVTHDALDAVTLGSRVLVLDDGRVAQVGTPTEVAAQPRTEHVARLVGLNVLREGADLTSFSPRDVTVSLHPPDGSARLRWHGRIVSATPHGDAVRLLVDSTPRLLADVTPQAAAELGLGAAREVWLSVKATAVSHYEAHASDR